MMSHDSIQLIDMMRTGSAESILTNRSPVQCKHCVVMM